MLRSANLSLIYEIGSAGGFLTDFDKFRNNSLGLHDGRGTVDRLGGLKALWLRKEEGFQMHKSLRLMFTLMYSFILVLNTRSKSTVFCFLLSSRRLGCH